MHEIEVLVVDDHQDVVDSLAQVLRARGYVVRTACDGAQDLAMCAQSQPDCLLLDLSMPHMTGTELARAVRARYGADIVLVAVSGRGDLDIQSEDLLPMDHWLKKPIDFDSFYKIFPKR